MNYLVALIFTLTALCTAHIYHITLDLTAFHLTASFALKKVLEGKKLNRKKGRALHSNFLLYCYLSDFFHGTLLATGFCCLQPLADSEGEGEGEGKREGEVGLVKVDGDRRGGGRGERDGCKCGIM